VPKLPSLTAKKVVRALKRAGFVEDRQKGSHLILIREESKARTVVPIHGGSTIKDPLLRAILRDANLSVEEFLACCDSLQAGIRWSLFAVFSPAFPTILTPAPRFFNPWFAALHSSCSAPGAALKCGASCLRALRVN
jgi:predicted RNA binding protein YcfA (HicA-like mRNA interferase family)